MGSPEAAPPRPLRRSSSTWTVLLNISSATVAAESAHSEISVVTGGINNRPSREEEDG